MSIEIYGAIYDQPLKGHDRLFIDRELCTAAVFDGAGGDELSEAAIRILPGLLARDNHIRDSSVELFLARVLTSLDSLPEAEHRRATAAMACAGRTAADVHIGYANAGDSSVYFYDHKATHLKQLAHTETLYVNVHGRTYIDTSEFLGNFRRSDQIKPLVGSLVVPASMEWSVLGFSDGVKDDDGNGINEAALLHIIKTKAATEVPDAILNTVEKYDDASVFIMSYRQA